MTESRRFNFRERVQKEFDPEEDRTHQSFKEQCDISRICKQAKAVGEWPPQPGRREPVYDDFMGYGDLKEHYDQVAAAEDLFYQLPAKVRELVDHDPAEFQVRLRDEEFVRKVSETMNREFLPEKPAEPPSEAVPAAGQAASDAAAPSEPEPSTPAPE